ncbi:alanine racemase [Krasilnikovia sp. MM14-A1004]|uniref:alanine racemase n=1 Tax=Krasilnikovia sp. MM14-A1004 TaxID=3373541 RepID=UPI00399D1CC1
MMIDLPRVDRNIHRLQELVAHAGRQLRVHVKGHRTPELATRQTKAGAVGIMAQTGPEAREYLRRGIDDCVISRPVLDPWRLAPLVRFAAQHAGPALAEGTARIVVAVSDPASVRGLGALAAAAGLVLPLRIDVKFDEDRGIVADRAGDLARLIEHTPGVTLDGVAGYRSYPDLVALKAAATQRAGSVAEVLVGLAESIRADGIGCPTVSVSGTANTAAALDTPGVTEICVGAGPLYDAGYALAGLCSLDDVAITLRATVLDTPGGRVRTDADHLLEGAGQDWDPDTLATLTDGTPLGAAALRQGMVVDLIPAHICPVAMNDVPREVIDQGRAVDRWHPVLLPETPAAS